MFSNIYNWIYIVVGAVAGVIFLGLAVADFSSGYSSEGGQDLLYALLSFVAGGVLFVLNRRQQARRAAAKSAGHGQGQGRW